MRDKTAVKHPSPPTRSYWRERVSARVNFLRMEKQRLAANNPPSPVVLEQVDNLLQQAEAAVQGPRFLSPPAAGVERAWAHIREADVALLRAMTPVELESRRPYVLAKAQQHLKHNDPRLMAVADKQRADTGPPATTRDEHEAAAEKLVTLLDAAYQAEDAELARVRSLKNLLWIVTGMACVGLAVFGIYMWQHPAALSLCFKPATAVGSPSARSSLTLVACPSADYYVKNPDVIPSTLATPTDIVSVGIAGLAGAALTVIVSLHNVPGSSSPYALSVAAAVLKLPTGAITAIIGIVLIGGGFIPGFSAIDTRAQILAWAVVFGASQHIVTRAVDDRAQKTLSQAGQAGVLDAKA